MSNYKINKTGAAMSAVCLGLALGTAHAAPLINFSNGAVADADDVNANFNELATRIDTVSLTPGTDGATGPQGPAGVQGPAGAQGAVGPAGNQGNQGNPGIQGIQGLKGDPGAQGPAGNDGAGILTYSWAGYGSSAWAKKVFIRKSGPNTYNQEERIFARTSTSATTGTTVMTRIRSNTNDANILVKHQKLSYSYDTQGAVLLTDVDNYTADGTTLVSQMSVSPGINLRNNAMKLGMTWATAAQTDTTYVDGSPDYQSFAVDSRSLVAVESITVQSVTYDNCYKILTNRSAATMGNHYQRISWFCPNNVGLVKYIQHRENGGTSNYQMLELDPNLSTLR